MRSCRPPPLSLGDPASEAIHLAATKPFKASASPSARRAFALACLTLTEEERAELEDCWNALTEPNSAAFAGMQSASAPCIDLQIFTKAVELVLGPEYTSEKSVRAAFDALGPNISGQVDKASFQTYMLNNWALPTSPCTERPHAVPKDHRSMEVMPAESMRPADIIRVYRRKTLGERMAKNARKQFTLHCNGDGAAKAAAGASAVWAWDSPADGSPRASMTNGRGGCMETPRSPAPNRRRSLDAGSGGGRCGTRCSDVAGFLPSAVQAAHTPLAQFRRANLLMLEAVLAAGRDTSASDPRASTGSTSPSSAKAVEHEDHGVWPCSEPQAHQAWERNATEAGGPLLQEPDSGQHAFAFRCHLGSRPPSPGLLPHPPLSPRKPREERLKCPAGAGSILDLGGIKGSDANALHPLDCLSSDGNPPSPGAYTSHSAGLPKRPGSNSRQYRSAETNVHEYVTSRSAWRSATHSASSYGPGSPVGDKGTDSSLPDSGGYQSAEEEGGVDAAAPGRSAADTAVEAEEQYFDIWNPAGDTSCVRPNTAAGLALASASLRQADAATELFPERSRTSCVKFRLDSADSARRRFASAAVPAGAVQGPASEDSGHSQQASHDSEDEDTRTGEKTAAAAQEGKGLRCWVAKRLTRFMDRDKDKPEPQPQVTHSSGSTVMSTRRAPPAMPRVSRSMEVQRKLSEPQCSVAMPQPAQGAAQMFQRFGNARGVLTAGAGAGAQLSSAEATLSIPTARPKTSLLGLSRSDKAVADVLLIQKVMNSTTRERWQ